MNKFVMFFMIMFVYPIYGSNSSGLPIKSHRYFEALFKSKENEIVKKTGHVYYIEAIDFMYQQKCDYNLALSCLQIFSKNPSGGWSSSNEFREKFLTFVKNLEKAKIANSISNTMFFNKDAVLTPLNITNAPINFISLTALLNKHGSLELSVLYNYSLGIS